MELALGIYGGVACYVLLLVWLAHSTPSGSWMDVTRRLKQPGDRYSLTLNSLEAVWNPSKPPGLDGLMYGPAVAVYELLPDGEIELTYSPADGPVRRLRGVPPPPKQGNRGVRRAVMAYLAVLLLGGVIAAVVAGGDASRRMLAGLLGMVVMIFVVRQAVIILRARAKPQTSQETGSAPSAARPRPVTTEVRQTAASHSLSGPGYRQLLATHRDDLRRSRHHVAFAAVLSFFGFVVFALPWMWTTLVGLLAWIGGLIWCLVAWLALRRKQHSIAAEAIARLMSRPGG